MQSLLEIMTTPEQAKVQDAVYRQEFGDYATISSVIDSTTKGGTRYNYGHGSTYFNSKSDPNRYVYHELIADYSSLRLRGQNTAIGFLRKVLGNEIFPTADTFLKALFPIVSS